MTWKKQQVLLRKRIYGFLEEALTEEMDLDFMGILIYEKEFQDDLYELRKCLPDCREEWHKFVNADYQCWLGRVIDNEIMIFELDDSH